MKCKLCYLQIWVKYATDAFPNMRKMVDPYSLSHYIWLLSWVLIGWFPSIFGAISNLSSKYEILSCWLSGWTAGGFFARTVCEAACSGDIAFIMGVNLEEMISRICWNKEIGVWYWFEHQKAGCQYYSQDPSCGTQCARLLPEIWLNFWSTKLSLPCGWPDQYSQQPNKI